MDWLEPFHKRESELFRRLIYDSERFARAESLGWSGAQPSCPDLGRYTYSSSQGSVETSDNIIIERYSIAGFGIVLVSKSLDSIAAYNMP